MQPLLTSINDAAKSLSLGRTTIYALIREGRVEPVKIGTRTLTRVESTHRLIGGATDTPLG